MRAACALRIFSGRIIFIFGIAERLRTLRYPIFTGGVVKASGIYRNQNKSPGGRVLSGEERTDDSLLI